MGPHLNPHSLWCNIRNGRRNLVAVCPLIGNDEKRQKDAGWATINDLDDGYGTSRPRPAERISGLGPSECQGICAGRVRGHRHDRARDDSGRDPARPKSASTEVVALPATRRPLFGRTACSSRGCIHNTTVPGLDGGADPGATGGTGNPHGRGSAATTERAMTTTGSTSRVYLAAPNATSLGQRHATDQPTLRPRSARERGLKRGAARLGAQGATMTRRAAVGRGCF